MNKKNISILLIFIITFSFCDVDLQGRRRSIVQKPQEKDLNNKINKEVIKETEEEKEEVSDKLVDREELIDEFEEEENFAREDESEEVGETVEAGQEAREEEEKDIFLNFENADLKTFVDYISNLKKINLIPDQKIAGNKISLSIREPLTVSGAWGVFLTILEMSGFSIIKVGDIHKVIPKSQKLVEPLPTYINVPSDTLPDSDITIRYVTFLANIPIEQIRGLLQSMLGVPSKIIPHPNTNGFVITDKSYNIKSAMKVIQELDRSDVKQSVTVMKLKQANADDVKKLFDSLMRKPQGNPLARLLGRPPEKSVEYFPPTTKIIAEPRTNSLILLGDQKSIKKIEDFVMTHVDTELKGVKSPIHIYELKHTDVDQIKNILEAITESNLDSPAAKHGGIRGGVKYFKKMKFAMDERNNRLLVSSTDDQDWKLLKKTIRDLDKPQPQVALETMIVSVEHNNTKELGSQIRNKKHGNLGRNIDFQAANTTPVIFEEKTIDNVKQNYSLLGNLMQTMVGELGSTILSFGSIAKEKVWGMIRMLQTKTNVTVLSKPFIVTTNMKEAEIKVGEKRRVAYQQAIAENTANTGIQGYEDASADLKIVVKPQINLDGVITMDIDIDISEFTQTNVTSPDTTEKKLKTKVSVANGQVLVLGGFVKTKVTETIYKTPFLSNIPILGWLFKNKNRSIVKEYIFIFMSPTIVKPRETPGTNLYSKMKLYQAKDDIEDAIEVRKIKDPIHNWFFNPEGETYSHKITDFSNARYQPTSVDILDDPYYRSKTKIEEIAEEEKEKLEEEHQDTQYQDTQYQDTQKDVKPEITPEKRPQISTPITPITQTKVRELRRQKLRNLLGADSLDSTEDIKELRKKQMEEFLE